MPGHSVCMMCVCVLCEYFYVASVCPSVFKSVSIWYAGCWLLLLCVCHSLVSKQDLVCMAWPTPVPWIDRTIINISHTYSALLYTYISLSLPFTHIRYIITYLILNMICEKRNWQAHKQTRLPMTTNNIEYKTWNTICCCCFRLILLALGCLTSFRWMFKNPSHTNRNIIIIDTETELSRDADRPFEVCMINKFLLWNMKFRRKRGKLLCLYDGWCN